MKIICISDTHNRHSEIAIPPGDVIVHAGDFTESGTYSETRNFLSWFSALPHPHKILIAGNHDFYLEKHSEETVEIIPSNIHYLLDSGVSIQNVNFWGSPYTPGDGTWAFNRNREKELQKHWSKIPKHTDFLITHTPPYKILDEIDNKTHIGSESLLRQINDLEIPHHVFGHVHQDYGIVRLKNTVFLNASSVNIRFHHINAPLVVHSNPS